MESLRMDEKYRTIDLCAGIGGIRRGFELTGKFENVLSAEIDPYAAKTYLHLFGEDPTNDLTSADFKKKVKETEYDVLLAGFPCQAFSSAGKKLGFEDSTRGTIFFHIAEIIEKTKPKAVFLENVQNIISHDKGRTIKTIIETLELELGYKVIGTTCDDMGNYSYSSKTLIRNTRFFGLPQNRPRAYLMAFSKAFFGPAILRIEGKTLPEKGTDIVFENVNDVLDLDVDSKYYMASGYWETLKRHKARQRDKGNGFGYCIVNQEGRKNQCANTLLATGGSGKERNLIFQPREGISGLELPSKKTALNKEGIRVMTPNEWGKLQGFIGYAFLDHGVEKFSFPDGIPDGQKYKQFGNSVSIPVIKTMATFMLDCFDQMMNCSEKKIYDYIKGRNTTTRSDIMNAFRMNYNQVGYVLKKLSDHDYIQTLRIGSVLEYQAV